MTAGAHAHIIKKQSMIEVRSSKVCFIHNQTFEKQKGAFAEVTLYLVWDWRCRVAGEHPANCHSKRNGALSWTRIVFSYEAMASTMAFIFQKKGRKK